MKLIATRDAYGEALKKLGSKNQNVVVLDADLAGSTKSSVFRDAFPDRFFNVGVAEQNLIGMASGLAVSGKIAYASSFAIFATGRAWEQIRNTVASSNLNVRIVGSHGGISVGEDGSSHQSLEDVAIMRSIPNMTIIIPADAVETEKAVFASAEYKGPIYIRTSRPKTEVVFDENYDFKIGKGSIVKPGDDVSIVSSGTVLNIALKAADILKNEGINCRVINIATIKPFDNEIIKTAALETKAIVTIEEHSIIGGLGTAVAEVLAENAIGIPFKRLGIKDVFGQSGTYEDLFAHYGLTENNLVNYVKEVLKNKK